MPSRGRRLARRYLPHRVRAAGLILLGKQTPPKPARPAKRAKAAEKAKAVKARRRKSVASAPKAAVPAQVRPAASVLRRGGTLPEALVAEVRRLLADQQRGAANAVATALLGEESSGDLGRLLAGIVASTGGYHRLAWSYLREVPEALWLGSAAGEFAHSGLQIAPAETLSRISELADRNPDDVSANAWLTLIGPVFGRGEPDLVARLFARLDARVGSGADVDKALVINRDWLRPWVQASPDGAAAPAVDEGVMSFAIMDYGHPSRARASANIGDHVQSLASLGHLARHIGLDYDGSQDLVDLLTQLRGRVRPELQRTAAQARVQLIQIDRDASSYAAIPPQTWTLAFGWYMHAIYESRYDFPFHPNLLPIFVSFHCSKRELLTEEAIDYLRRFAPIGCRDWTTVDILLSVGVPAFFSGCLTTTVRTVFDVPVTGPPADAPVAYVDMDPSVVPKGAPVFAHSSDAIRFRSFATNIADASDLLDRYRRDFRGLVTKRLHCYLPVRSLGAPVDFQPNNRSDPRFAGLIDITDEEFHAIQSRIDGLLEPIIEAIAGGQSAEQVYELWRELNSADVALAERRRASDHPLPPVRTALIGELPALREQLSELGGDATTVVVAVPQRGAQAVRVLIGSVAARASGPVQFVLLSRAGDALDASAIRAAAAGHLVQVVDTRGLGEDLQAAGRRPAAADIDRLVLAELLDPLDRVVVLPYDAVVEADIASLAAVDLGGHLFAAPEPAGRTRVSGFGILNNAANRLGKATTAAAELRRRGYARHTFDFDAFDPEVMVLDLAAWRSGGLTALSLSYIEEFGFTRRELLHFLVGPDWSVLPERWHAVPGRSIIEDPALVHWSEEPRPWSDDIAREQQRWFAARAQLEADTLAR